mmetsp:Transcript_12828/g.26030  ORF Transcript_12828/g.26030 Transcript_12828/m.26030 type:complete len:90 (+) Transcript_12828:447-716(+)|eukprot:CAMPEP_0184685020 /NCGR_PEP_ID=MMETSP0312-20130426/17392_1 /TAXON_ID=31354 /ORGANISM="Compsopogon coeruleus, Strain SAG 36.94" /LENGTH=89 /DNA_ID=CAMNT_0027138719 /DNA_START=434 /DNA_END=703 /DNA_ORIENTATION=+
MTDLACEYGVVDQFKSPKDPVIHDSDAAAMTDTKKTAYNLFHSGLRSLNTVNILGGPLISLSIENHKEYGCRRGLESNQNRMHPMYEGW